MKTIIAAALALLVALPATAQDFQKGLAAYERKDYTAALKEWRPLAAKGDARGQTGLGNLYRTGGGVRQSFKESVRWYRKAAAQGLAEAQNHLGDSYNLGDGVSKDYAEAANWYRKAAEQGYATAQSNLGTMYAEGKGVPRDYVLAHLWFSLSADKGTMTASHAIDEFAKRLTPAQLAEAQKLAREWWAKHKKR